METLLNNAFKPYRKMYYNDVIASMDSMLNMNIKYKAWWTYTPRISLLVQVGRNRLMQVEEYTCNV